MALKKVIEAGVSKVAKGAGLDKAGEALSKVGEDVAVKNIEQKLPGDVTELPTGEIIIKADDTDDLDVLNTLLEGVDYNKGINFSRVGKFFDEGLDDLNIGEFIDNIKTNNKELFEKQRRGELPMETLKKMADTTGYDELIKMFLTAKPGNIAKPEETLGGLLAVIRLSQELQAGAKKALTLEGPQKKEAYRKVMLLANATTKLAASVSASASEYGRGLSVVSNMAKLRDFNLDQLIDDVSGVISEMDEGTINYNLFSLTSLTKKAQRAKFAENLPESKTLSAAMEMYINALLSSPVTHMINIGGNLAFQIQTLAERGMAGLVGSIRTAGDLGRGGMTGANTITTKTGKKKIVHTLDDRAYASEAAAEAYGMMMAQKDALILMARTAIRGRNEDLGKIDLKARTAIGGTDDISEIAGNLAQGDIFNSTIDILGVLNRIPGRMLATEDAYFKAITKRRVLYREAHLRSQVSYRNARQAGLSPEKAKELSSKKYQDVISKPPQDVLDLMEKDALKMTFQNRPEGIFGAMPANLTQHPLMKIIVPFYNTPTNIINAVFDRTLNVYPVYKAIKTGTGREFDEAMGKLLTGNAIVGATLMLTNGMLGDDIVIRGSISPNKKIQRNIASGANVPLYSFGIKQEDGGYRNYTFSRFDPLSGLMMMAADYTMYMRMAGDDPKALEYAQSMLTAMTLSVAEYAGNMPFLQGVSELFDAASNRSGDPERWADRMQYWMGNQVGSLVTNVAGSADRMTFGGVQMLAEKYHEDFPMIPIPTDSYKRVMERVANPLASNTGLPEEYVGSGDWMRGFYTALQRAKAGNPAFSGELLTRLNFWGEEVTQGEGRTDEYYNPIRIQNGQLNSLDKELIRLADVGAGAFSPHKNKINEIYLSDVEQDQYVRFINDIDVYKGYGGKYKYRLPGDIGYDETNTLAFKLDAVMESDEYKDEIIDDNKYAMLSDVVSRRRLYAKEALIKEIPRLSYLFGED